jgi:hypothetical protein
VGDDILDSSHAMNSAFQVSISIRKEIVGVFVELMIRIIVFVVSSRSESNTCLDSGSRIATNSGSAKGVSFV